MLVPRPTACGSDAPPIWRALAPGETMLTAAVRLTRRQLMRTFSTAAGGLLAWSGTGVSPARAATPTAERERLMARAFELRRMAVERGDQAFGAVVVRDGRVVGEGVSAVLTTPDPTAHG